MAGVKVGYEQLEVGVGNGSCAQAFHPFSQFTQRFNIECVLISSKYIHHFLVMGDLRLPFSLTEYLRFACPFLEPTLAVRLPFFIDTAAWFPVRFLLEDMFMFMFMFFYVFLFAFHFLLGG